MNKSETRMAKSGEQEFGQGHVFWLKKQKPELKAPALMKRGRAKLTAELATQQGSEAQNTGAEEHQAGGLWNGTFRELVRQQRKGSLSACAGLNLNALRDIDFLYSRKICAVKQLASHTAVGHAQRDFLSAGARREHGPQTGGLGD